MIIPVRCFTCGKVLANKWEAYKKSIEEEREHQQTSKNDETSDTANNQLADNFDKNLKGHILDKLHIERVCCRRHFIAHVDLIDII